MTDRELAEFVWKKYKGKELEENLSDEQLRRIIYGYWHKAMEKDQ